MDNQIIAHVARELARELMGSHFGKIAQVTRATFALDLRSGDAHNHGFARPLLISIEPSQPRVHLISKRWRDIERDALPPNSFALTLRKHLAGAALIRIEKDADDRVVRFAFSGRTEAGAPYTRTLVAGLTGRSANLFVLDDANHVIDSARPSHAEGTRIGEHYVTRQRPAISSGDVPDAAPRDTPTKQSHLSLALAHNDFADAPSANLERYFDEQERTRRFETRAAALLAGVRKEITKREALRRNLEHDLAAHGDPAAHKRIGDLLLANLANAERQGNRVRVVDYFDDLAPIIEFEVDEHSTLQEEAARRFTRFAKAKRALEHTTARLNQTTSEIDALDAQRQTIERIIADEDDAALDKLASETTLAKRRHTGATPDLAATKNRAKKDHTPARSYRAYRSIDGYEILVGRGARSNDELTFKIARPHDVWLHAADYPGAHVVIRNGKRTEVPQRTVHEAAQLAAFNSDAKTDSRVSVNYTQRKFITKPKGAAPGMVRLSSFRTMLVEPRESGERI